jgi:hypothetical protein
MIKHSLVVVVRGAAVCLVLAALPTPSGAADPEARGPVRPVPQRSGSAEQRVAAVLEFLAQTVGTGQEPQASPHQPPGRPEDRPPGSPPGQNDPPNPPGKPSDRPPAQSQAPTR